MFINRNNRVTHRSKSIAAGVFNLSAGPLFSAVLCVVLTSALVGMNSVAWADPMRPPGFGVASTKKAYQSTNFVLSQILISEQRKRAIINEKLVSEGDRVAGAKVLRIDPDKVILRVDGKQRVLAINTAKGLKIKRETE